MMEELTGKISNVVFSNKQTGFHVLKVAIEKDALTRVVGSFPGVNIASGLKAKFRGKWEIHNTYGKQLTASSCELIPEKTKSGIVSYLTSQISSIGPVTANRLYDTFGEELLSVLDKDPERIRTCAFLTKIQCDTIIKDWLVVNDQRDSSIYLSGLGLNTNQIKSIYTIFGPSIRNSIKEDPYCIIKATGVGFITADAVARKLGIDTDDPKRIKAIIVYIITELCISEGHTYVTSSQIFDYANKRLFRKGGVTPFSHGEFLSDSHFYSALTSCINAGELVVEDEKIYLAKIFNEEKTLSTYIASLLCRQPRTFQNLASSLEHFEKSKNLVLSPDQKAAYLSLSKSRFLTVTGYPGTGKTTLITAFVDLCESENLSYTLVSPTGIAAKRLSQVTKRPASTIHRAFGYKKDGTWEFHQGNKYAVDVIIVDEMSMVDLPLFSHLLSSIHPDTTVICVGDDAQLPSVGYGSVLTSLTKCEDIIHVSLTKIYRQGKTSDIISVAHSILSETPINTEFDRDSEFVFLNMKTDLVMDEIKKLCTKLKDGNRNFQVISPMYEGTLGVNALNKQLRSILNPSAIEHKSVHVRSGETDIYEGDRVMVIKNDYDRMIYNGDVGKVSRINLKDDEVDVKIYGWFDSTSTIPQYIDKVMTFKVEEARTLLKVAYACTAHKSQGQEYDYVILPMTKEFSVMLYKNLVYTSITRAKKKVFVFGDPNAFLAAVTNTRNLSRNTNLPLRVHDYYQKLLVHKIHDA